MIDLHQVPEVTDDELLARYIVFSKFIRNDQTIKPGAFMPHPHRNLSVTRHLNAIEQELWAVGHHVAHFQNRSLYGRSDIQAQDCAVSSLKVKSKPLPNNPNHADIEDWPEEKQDQKSIALELAAAASNLIPPPTIS
ncbi:MAG: hypothetical protein AAF152_11290 [Cyanobacteria bacterium P01_A01_bin.114]